MISEPVFSIRSIYMAYLNSKESEAKIVLNNVDLDVEENEFLCILGPSGCGKTTLLNLMAGFEFPLKGKVLYKGKEVKGPGPERGVMFQEFSLIPWMDVQSNVVFGMNRKKYSEKERREMALNYLDMVELRDSANQRPISLSGGMKQRVAIARTLAMEPECMLMDEPFCNLDEQTKKRLDVKLLEIWKDKRTTVVFITHSIDEALTLGTRIILMSKSPGKIVSEWNMPEDFDRNPDSADYLRYRSEIRAAFFNDD